MRSQERRQSWNRALDTPLMSSRCETRRETDPKESRHVAAHTVFQFTQGRTFRQVEGAALGTKDRVREAECLGQEKGEWIPNRKKKGPRTPEIQIDSMSQCRNMVESQSYRGAKRKRGTELSSDRQTATSTFAKLTEKPIKANMMPEKETGYVRPLRTSEESPQNCTSESIVHVFIAPSVTREYNDPP